MSSIELNKAQLIYLRLVHLGSYSSIITLRWTCSSMPGRSTAWGHMQPIELIKAEENILIAS